MAETASKADEFVKSWLLEYIDRLHTIEGMDCIGQSIAEDKDNGVAWTKDAEFMASVRAKFSRRREEILAFNRANKITQQTLR